MIAHPQTAGGKGAMDAAADMLEIHRAGWGRASADRRVCWRKKSNVGPSVLRDAVPLGAQTRTCLDQVSWLPLVALAATTHLLRKVLPDNIRLVLATSADGNLWE